MPRNNGSKVKRLADLSTCYIPCQIAPGMFREEYLVYLDAAAPHDPSEKARAQLLVDQREVSGITGTPQRHHPARAWLRVTLLGRRADWSEVVLPQPSQPFGERVLVAGDSVTQINKLRRPLWTCLSLQTVGTSRPRGRATAV